MKHLFSILALLLPGLLLAQPADQAWVDIDPPQPTAYKDKVLVEEVFSYMCPHCNNFEPYMKEWEKNKADYIVFERLPAEFNRRSWIPVARLYYTAQILGVLDKAHPAVFKRIHEQRKFFRSEDDVVDFLTAYGLDENKVRSTYNSFAVETKLRRAQTLISRYGVTGVPAVIVNGKYRTNATLAKGYPNLIKTINQLAEQEAKAMGLLK